MLDRGESASLAHEARRRTTICEFAAMGYRVCSGSDAFATLIILLWPAFTCAGAQGGQEWTGPERTGQDWTSPSNRFLQRNNYENSRVSGKRHSGEVWCGDSAWRGRQHAG